MRKTLIAALVTSSLLLPGLLHAAAARDTAPASLMPAHARNPAITTPAAVFGFEPGEWHLRPEQLTAWYQKVAQESPRAKLSEIGRSHEQRPLLSMVISSPENLAQLDALIAKRERGDSDAPLVVYLGYSVHGNEPSGANVAPLVAWHLLSSEDPSVKQLLDRTIILFDPMLNPDGLARFAHWANSWRGETLNSDPQTQEHKEAWPSGRGNHYWFDLNRDYLWLAHPESRARVALFQKWRPNIVADFHEQGTDATFFFQPGIPSRTHPLTPARNQQLTELLGAFHAKSFDRRGEPYFSREAFDDFYYGKGSTYPDIQGSVGILFEQASSRGHVQQSRNGELHFRHTLANQFSASLSMLEGADALRGELLAFRKQADTDALAAARADGHRAQLFALKNNPARLQQLALFLQQHGLQVHRAKTGARINGSEYAADDIVVVPLQQRQYPLLQAITEFRTEFRDNAFYDVSAWSLIAAYDLASEKTKSDLIGDAFVAQQDGRVNGRSGVAYAFDWQNDDAARVLARLSKQGLQLRVASKPLQLRVNNVARPFGIGSIIVPVALQTQDAAALHATLERAVAGTRLQIDALDSGAGTGGIDLGSASLKSVESPRIALLTGNGVDSTAAGEIWHWLDTHLQLPATHLPGAGLGDINLDRYTHLLIVDGTYRFSEETQKQIEQFVRKGGVLIGLDGGVNALAGFSWLKTKAIKSEKEKAADNNRRAYVHQSDDAALERIAGAIFNTEIDLTHPLAAGLPRAQLPVFRAHDDVFQLEGNRYATVAAYSEQPVLSGYVSDANRKKIRGTAALTAERVGSGSVILATATLGFRSGWLGSRKLLDNALFFGKTFDRPGAGGEDEDAH